MIKPALVATYSATAYDTAEGITAFILTEVHAVNIVVSVLGGVFFLVSIIKIILDIRYHPANRPDDEDNEQVKRRADNPGGTKEL